MSMTNYQLTQKGSSLIEVLVALLVLGVGLLGMLGLQNQATKFSQAALNDSQARFAINEIIERVRLNTKVKVSNASLYALSKDSTPSDPVGQHCDSTTCTAGQLAAWDVWQWLTTVKSTLPNGKAEIKFNQNTNELTVSIFYNTANLNQQASLSSGQVVGADTSERQINVVTRIR